MIIFGFFENIFFRLLSNSAVWSENRLQFSELFHINDSVIKRQHLAISQYKIWLLFLFVIIIIFVVGDNNNDEGGCGWDNGSNGNDSGSSGVLFDR